MRHFFFFFFPLQDKNTQLFNSRLLRFLFSSSDKIVSDCIGYIEEHPAFPYPWTAYKP